MIRAVKTEGDGGPMLETFLHKEYSGTRVWDQILTIPGEAGRGFSEV